MKRINLVLEGSGILGIAYIGAVKYLTERGYVLNRIAATSSGSLFGALLAAGYTANEMEIITLETNFAHLIGDLNLSLREKIELLIVQNGIYNGDILEAWLNDLLEAKGIYTFKDLKLKGVVKSYEIMATDVTRGNALVLPQDLKQYNIEPLSYPVAKGVRMSISIPYFFTPVVLEFNNNINYISDGGVVYNYPINFFEGIYNTNYNRIPTIGVRMSPGSISFKENYDIDVLNYTVQLIGTLSSNSSAPGSIAKYIDRTISIPPVGVSPLEFDLTQEDKIRLINSGYNSAKAFIEGYYSKEERI